MNTPEPATLGAVLMLLGLALAFLAAYVLLNRRVEDPKDEKQPALETEAEQSDDDPSSEPDPAAQSVDSADQAESEADSEGSDKDTSEEDEAGAEPSDSDEPVPIPQSELMQVLDVYREEVSGELVLKIGDREYRAVDEIEDEGDRRRIESALADLNSWFTEAPEPPAAPQPSEEAASPTTGNGGPPSQPVEAEQRKSSRAESAKPRSPSAARGMIDGINALLRENLERDENGPRAVRLVSDASGAVKVLIGLKSYPMEDIPDEDVRRLIRQAVQEWEASQ